MFRERFMARIFISYSRADQRDVEQFIGYLPDKYKHQVWYDKHLKAGQEWWKLIQDQIGIAEVFIYLISNESLQSEYCQKEFRSAVHLKKNIIPVIMRRCNLDYAPDDIRGKLQNIHWVDMQNGQTLDNYRQLINALDHILRTDVSSPKQEISSHIEPNQPTDLNHTKKPPSSRPVLYGVGGMIIIVVVVIVLSQISTPLTNTAEPTLTALEYHRMGTEHARNKEYEDAIIDYTNAIVLDTQSAMLYINRGISYYQLERYQEAIDDYTEGININPQYQNAYNNRGLAYREMKQYDQAIANHEEAIRINPKEAISYNYLGIVYEEMDNCQQAIIEYRRALEANPDYTVAQTNLDRVLANCDSQ